MRLFCRFRLVSVDILLRPPQDLKSRLLCFLKRTLLTQVDKFILYFKNTAGYQRYYGIRPEKSTMCLSRSTAWKRAISPGRSGR